MSAPQDLKTLIDVCLSCNTPLLHRVCFCSSAGPVLRTDGATIDKKLPFRFEDCQPMAYAQSKLVVQHICTGASSTADTAIYIVRIGQLIGDTEKGVWNHVEEIPLIMQTAKAIGALTSVNEELR